MPVSKEYQHFCPVARSLEVIGEKWSLLVVRDLLRGPLRFSDLQRYLGGITPKWLTQRLRDLEDAGIVEREQEAGRREVWYRLTEKGRALGPAVEALAVWGAEFAMRPPRTTDAVFPEQMVMLVAALMRRHRIETGRELTWRFDFDDGAASQTLSTDGRRWRAWQGAPKRADVTITAASPRSFAGFLTAGKRGRREARQTLRIDGPDDDIVPLFEMLDAAAATARSAAKGASARA